MTSDSKACPNCEAPMTVMASMPSIQRQGSQLQAAKLQASWSFFLCPQCGKVERERFERPSAVEDGDAETPA